MLSDRLKSLREGLIVAAVNGQVDDRLAVLVDAELATAIEQAEAMEARPVPLYERLRPEHLVGGKVKLWPVVTMSREGGR